MSNNGNGNNKWRTSPLYTVTESAHLAGVSTDTIRRWLYGCDKVNYTSQPILGDQDKTRFVSFLQLAEILVAKGFRRNHMPLERIRDAHDYLEEKTGLEYPFAIFRLEAVGGHILHMYQEEKPGTNFVALDTKGEQWTLPGIVTKIRNDFGYEQDLAACWYPMGKAVPIVVNPRFSSGMPTIEDRRVTVEAVYKRFKAGYPIRFIASDLRIKQKEIEDALRFVDLRYKAVV